MRRFRQGPEPDRLVRSDVLADLSGSSLRTFWRRVRAGVLPPPTIAGKPNLFDVAEVIRYTESTDRFLSCEIAGQWARLRQARRVSAMPEGRMERL